MRNEQNSDFVDAFNGYLRKCTASEDQITHTNPADIAKVLGEFNDQKYAVNFHWETTGWFTLRGIDLIGGDLELAIERRVVSQVTPKLLETFYFTQKPDFSFMRLAYEGLQPSGVYPNTQSWESEEVIEANGHFHPRECWDTEILGYDAVGNKIPLPADARIVLRELQDGHFMFLSKGSALNDSGFDKQMRNIAKYGTKSEVYKQVLKIATDSRKK